MIPLVTQWKDAPTQALLAMVYRYWDGVDNELGSSLIDYRKWACPALDKFMMHAMNILGGLPGQGKFMVFAVITRPGQKAGGWARGYPHTHGYAHYSLVHYLDPGDALAPLVVFDNNTPHFLVPERGMTVVFEGHQNHGVLDSAGEHPRIALVLQSMPAEMQVTH